MNIRISKLYQGAPWSALEVAFNSAPEGTEMIAEIASATGLDFKRPPANMFGLRELHIAQVGDEQALEEAFVRSMEVAEKYGEVLDSQKNMKGPGEVTPNELGKAMGHEHGPQFLRSNN
ncbi:MAG: hypothetical protein M3014_06565 [Chloroflexota bacterium]|nr:hypothetical protein [Chloroflexota bacterium]